MTTPQAIILIRNIVGTSPSAEYEYLLAGTILILFNVGIFLIVSNFQKSFSRRSGR